MSLSGLYQCGERAPVFVSSQAAAGGNLHLMPGLPDDWHPTIRDMIARVWAANPQRERLDALWHERDEAGERKWFQVIEDDPEDATWSRLMLRPSHARDTRPAIRVGRWPTKVVTDEDLDVQAILDQHHTD